MWRKGLDIFRYGIFSFSSTICWKTIFSCWKSVDWPWTHGFISNVLFPLVFMSVLMAVPYWLDYCSFIGSFKVSLCNSFNFVLFQISLEKKQISLIFFFFYHQRKFIFLTFGVFHLCIYVYAYLVAIRR